MSRFERLEDVLPGWNDWPGSLDDSFEDLFLRPRLQALHPEATVIRFCGGTGNVPGPYRNRTVQIWNGATLVKTYKYGAD